MRKLILAAALAALATPALAQSYSHDFGTGNVDAAPVQQQFQNESTGALAYEPRQTVRGHRQTMTRGHMRTPVNGAGVREDENY